MAAESSKQVSTGSEQSDFIVIAKLGAVYGVKGWLKLHSYTEPADNLLHYENYYISSDSRGGDARVSNKQWQSLELTTIKPHSNSWIAHIDNVDDRDVAKQFTGREIAVRAADLPELPSDEYYWHQLEGLKVLSQWQGSSHHLGKVSEMLATGANDVIAVGPTADSIDQRERLIPYLPDTVVLAVDLTAGEMAVEWDPEF